MRFSSLDYLRGLAALGIVIYHFNFWNFGAFDATSVISRFGLYGVSIFYMLSGLTLFHTYENRMFIKEGIGPFFIKRFLRIMPLLWLATTFTILGAKAHFGVDRIFLSYSGLFSFLAPQAYIAGGAWSIGNEICFYLVFPLLLLSFQRKRIVFYVLIALFLLAHVYYAFFIFTSDKTIPAQWGLYISPLNQAAFFAAGIMIYLLNKRTKISMRYAFILLVSGILLFAFFPITGARSTLILGFINLLFFLFSCIIVYGALNIKATTVLPMHRSLEWLGEVSYSVYLLHPLVWKLVNIMKAHYLKNLDFAGIFSISVVLTLIISHVTYNYFEVKVSKLGRKFMQ